MKKSSEKSKNVHAAMQAGVCSKREAVAAIYAGCRHVHSSELGKRDPAAKQTETSLSEKKVPTYSWEESPKTVELKLTTSGDRKAVIDQIVAQLGIEKKRVLREKVESVLEELITNALYHAYQAPPGQEKYARRAGVTLTTGETLAIRFHVTENGLFLSVGDQAGTLKFSDIANSLHRCYTSKVQIETKEGGAGLGTYLVFDSVTHMKIVSQEGRGTTVSVWIADQRSYNPEHFSFNFFRTGED